MLTCLQLVGHLVIASSDNVESHKVSTVLTQASLLHFLGIHLATVLVMRLYLGGSDSSGLR